jgi:hypothetical protein
MFGKVHALQQMEGTQFLPLATTACELYTDWGVIKSEVYAAHLFFKCIGVSTSSSWQGLPGSRSHGWQYLITAQDCNKALHCSINRFVLKQDVFICILNHIPVFWIPAIPAGMTMIQFAQ